MGGGGVRILEVLLIQTSSLGAGMGGQGAPGSADPRNSLSPAALPWKLMEEKGTGVWGVFLFCSFSFFFLLCFCCCCFSWPLLKTAWR